MIPPAKPLALQTYRIEVKLKSEIFDAEGHSAMALLQASGLSGAKDVRVRRVYVLRGPFSNTQAQQIAKELLCDPVTQEFRLLSTATPVLNGMNHWRIEIQLKNSVSDPVGETVGAAVASMGLPKPETSRVCLAYHIVGRASRGQIEKAALRALANPVVHDICVSEASQ
jgi:phosphoribosylformylglycinamidine (FGAM) synthase PurS component